MFPERKVTKSTCESMGNNIRFQTRECEELLVREEPLIAVYEDLNLVPIVTGGFRTFCY